MKWLLLATLILSGALYADPIRDSVSATADTYLYDQRNVVSTAGSFTIWPSSAALVAMAGMNSLGSPDRTNANYATTTTAIVGFSSSAENRLLLRFETLADSMRTYSPAGKYIQWDSAVVTLIPSTSVDSVSGTTGTDSVTFAMYELRPARRFDEASATWNSYKTDSLWTTPGAGSEASDYLNTLLDTTATLTKGMTVANDTTNLWCQFNIPGTNITDTLNNAGVVIRYLRTGSDDGTTTTRAIFHTDDATTAAYRPRLKVYFHEVEYPDFGGADTLLMKTTDPETQKAYPVMTFDISSVTATATLTSCSVYVYLNASYSNNTEGSIDVLPSVAMKPINIGTGTGGATATGKLHWASWYENGTADSAWGTIGATNTGYICNRSAGADDDKTNDTAANTVIPSGTGYKPFRVDTVAVRAYLDGSCSNFAIIMQPTVTAGDDAHFVLSSVEGANDPYLIINYTPGATAVTKGTGRFGRTQDGRYINVR